MKPVTCNINIRIVILALFISFLPACSPAQNDGIQTREQLTEDLQQLKKILETDHPQLYRFTSREEFDSLYDEAEQSFYDNMDLVEAFKAFGRIVGAVGCGHTIISMPDGFWEKYPDGYLPLEVIISNNQVIVSDRISGESGIEPGAEIKEINGASIREIVDDLRKYSTGDGQWNSRRDYLAGMYFAHRIAAFTGFPQEYHIGFINPGKDSIQHENITSVQSYKLNNPGARKDDFEVKTGLPGNTSYLAIRSFGYYDDVDGFKEQVDSAFKNIEQAGSENLIIDLRENSGGDPHCSTHLMSYLIPEPVPYFAKKFFGYQSYADPLPVFDNRFKGDIYILIGGGCFSTTGHVTSLLKYHGFAIFIGEETGGTFTCNDASREFTLKNTGFKGSVARGTFFTAVEGMSWAEGVQPDHEVFPTPKDIAEGKDAVLEYAIKLILDHQD